jgi:hypothetical protein
MNKVEEAIWTLECWNWRQFRVAKPRPPCRPGRWRQPPSHPHFFPCPPPRMYCLTRRYARLALTSRSITTKRVPVKLTVTVRLSLYRNSLTGHHWRNWTPQTTDLLQKLTVAQPLRIFVAVCRCGLLLRTCFTFGRSRIQTPGWRRLSWQILEVFMSPSRRMPEQHLKLAHDHFPPYPFESINHPTSRSN